MPTVASISTDLAQTSLMGPALVVAAIVLAVGAVMLLRRLPVADGSPEARAEALGRMVEEGRRIGAELEGKIARLERLIGAADDRLSRLERAAGPAPDAHDPLTLQVYAMADAGVEPVEIARRLEQHRGKVDLILALRSKRGLAEERGGMRE